MHFRKIILIIVVCIVGALFFLKVSPMRRTYKAVITVNANNTITGRTIADTANWHIWYINPDKMNNNLASFGTATEKAFNNYNYAIQTNNNLKKGSIRLTRSNKWNTELAWTEEFEINDGLLNKLELLFNPSYFRKPFFENIVQFKDYIEHPDSIFGGITFERIEVPTNTVAIKSDTIAASELENAISKLYDDITAALPASSIKEPGAFLSQYEKINDSLIALNVAVEINETEKELKKPFAITELESHSAITMHITKNYADLDTDISIMYEWLKKNNVRPAASFWVKHNPGNNIAMISPDSKLTVIQEIYSL